MDSIRQDLLHALRMLRHSPRFVVLVAFILALGIGANTAMFSIAYAWLWRPLAFPNPEQLVSVWRTSLAEPSQPAYFNLYHDYLAWSAQSRSFQSLAATFEQPYDLTGAGDPVQVHGAVASWNLFLTVGATMQLGRGFLAEDVQGGPACIISHALWRERFHSSPSIIGQSITLNRESYRVVGVLPSDFSLRVLDRTFETAVWTLITDSDRRYDPNSASAIAVMGRLNPGTTPEQAQAELSGIQLALDRRFPKDEPENSGVLVVNLQQDNTRTIRESLLLMFAAVALLLLIACANAGSLILGRNSQRAKEFAVRVALGCRATRLFQQLTIEVLVLFTIGGFAGLGIAYAAIRAFVAWNPFAVLPPGEIALSAKVLAATAAILGSAAVIFGSLPAFRSLRLDETDALRSSSAATSGRRQLRSRTLFVVAEISISALLLVGAGLLLSTFLALNSEPLGMRTQDVYVSDVSLPNSRYASVRDQDHFSEMLLNKLRQSPDVRAAGISLSWPYQVNGLGPVELATRHDASIDDMPQAAKFLVSDGYFDALGIPLVRGREFAANDGQSAGFAVINQAMAAKYFAGRDPIGERLRLRYSDEKGRSVPWLIVIGVVGDTLSQRYNQVQWDRYPAVYTSFFQREENPFLHNWDSVELRMYMRGTPGISEREIAAAVHSIDPDLPLGSFRRASDIVGELRSQPRVRATLMSSFGLLTLILAATGIAGIMSQMVEQRRREMGIRIALGAMRSEIVSLVLRRALTLTAIGLLAGLAISAAAGRWLRSFLYDTSALNFKVFGAVIGLLMAVALLAAYLPAQRAAKMDPIDSLRSE